MPGCKHNFGDRSKIQALPLQHRIDLSSSLEHVRLRTIITNLVWQVEIKTEELKK